MFPLPKNVYHFLNNVLARTLGQPTTDYPETNEPAHGEQTLPLPLTTKDDAPELPDITIDENMPLEELLDLAIQAGKVNVYFHDPIVTPRANSGFTLTDNTVIMDPGPCVAGSMIAELHDKEGHLTEVVSGKWEVSLLPFCPPSTKPHPDDTLTMMDLIGEIQEGTLDPDTIALPDLLAAADKVDVVDITFGKRGRIEKLHAIADGIEMEGTLRKNS